MSINGKPFKLVYCRHCGAKVEHQRHKHLWDKHHILGTVREHFLKRLPETPTTDTEPPKQEV